jgi:hypothetical protein
VVKCLQGQLRAFFLAHFDRAIATGIRATFLCWFDPVSWTGENWPTPKDQYLNVDQDNNSVMFSGPLRINLLRQERNKDGKGYKINSNQAIYENRDNQPKK